MIGQETCKGSLGLHRGTWDDKGREEKTEGNGRKRTRQKKLQNRAKESGSDGKVWIPRKGQIHWKKKSVRGG